MCGLLREGLSTRKGDGLDPQQRVRLAIYGSGAAQPKRERTTGVCELSDGDCFDGYKQMGLSFEEV
jgi:hypothetical protein